MSIGEILTNYQSQLESKKKSVKEKIRIQIQENVEKMLNLEKSLVQKLENQFEII